MTFEFRNLFKCYVFCGKQYFSRIRPFLKSYILTGLLHISQHMQTLTSLSGGVRLRRNYCLLDVPLTCQSIQISVVFFDLIIFTLIRRPRTQMCRPTTDHQQRGIGIANMRSSAIIAWNLLKMAREEFGTSLGDN